MTENEFKIKVLSLANSVYPLARRLLGTDDLAHDAIQQSMMKLWEHRKQLDQCVNIRAFVFKVVRNVCLDEMKRRKPVSVEEPGNYSQHSYRQDNLHDEKEMVLIVQHIIESLVQNQKEVITLRDMNGFEFEEIAEITGMDVAYIRVLLSRARKNVKEYLDKIYEYEAIRKE